MGPGAPGVFCLPDWVVSREDFNVDLQAASTYTRAVFAMCFQHYPVGRVDLLPRLSEMYQSWLRLVSFNATFTRSTLRLPSPASSKKGILFKTGPLSPPLQVAPHSVEQKKDSFFGQVARSQPSLTFTVGFQRTLDHASPALARLELVRHSPHTQSPSPLSLQNDSRFRPARLSTL